MTLKSQWRSAYVYDRNQQRACSTVPSALFCVWSASWLYTSALHSSMSPTYFSDRIFWIKFRRTLKILKGKNTIHWKLSIKMTIRINIVRGNSSFCVSFSWNLGILHNTITTTKFREFVPGPMIEFMNIQ